jgi:superfamily II DNA or RNA helicase
MFAPFAETHINLINERVQREDAARQARTASEILRRFQRQPGVVLADEVGMGKTFVAMAVAASIILDRDDEGPVVVMVPPSLRGKWPRDWEVFQHECLSPAARARIRSDSADSGISFLRLLDDPPSRRKHLIFLTHGAMHRSLTDGYAKLAVIKRAFKGRSTLMPQRENFYKFAGKLLRLRWVEDRAPGLLGELLERPYEKWLRIIHRAHESFKQEVTDDPVPLPLQEALEGIGSEVLMPVVEELRKLPIRSNASDERLKQARRSLDAVMDEVWRLALVRARFRSPLLILDEAHHLKNPATLLASLFVDEEAAQDSKLFERGGALGGKFDRMMFLTATPFQLGHAELISVLERFGGINWQAARRPALSRAEFVSEISTLASALDDARAAALRLDRAWGKLTPDTTGEAGGPEAGSNEWWEALKQSENEGPVGQVIAQVESTRRAMSAAETRLQPWVLRHLKSRHLPNHPDVERRFVLPGAAIKGGRTDTGLEIEGDALFPFLLAGRAQGIVQVLSGGRIPFAEGLASSFEAFVETRSKGSQALDEDTLPSPGNTSEEVDWYLKHLEAALPADSDERWASHPKIRATTERVVELWTKGEKVLIFCHYRATGRALRQHISARLDAEIIEMGQRQLGVSGEVVRGELERLGKRFFDTDGLLYREVNKALDQIVGQFSAFDKEQAESMVEVIRRFLRTPTFLVRYFDLKQTDHARAFADAIQREDLGGLSLRRRIEDFSRFLAERCIPAEREGYLAALKSIETGTHTGRDVAATVGEDEEDGKVEKTLLLPNVRLANGEVAADVRQKLMLAFNTPLFPEILIASSVLAEGVDLHLSCRYVIHHDLCWNPSTLEQRTGRVDRLGSKAEQIGEPINIYLPYVAATQDEKMYRVVRDREKWFDIVMGEKYTADDALTDRQAERIPLPPAVHEGLTLKLGIRD